MVYTVLLLHPAHSARYRTLPVNHDCPSCEKPYITAYISSSRPLSCSLLTIQPATITKLSSFIFCSSLAGISPARCRSLPYHVLHYFNCDVLLDLGRPLRIVGILWVLANFACYGRLDFFGGHAETGHCLLQHLMITL